MTTSSPSVQPVADPFASVQPQQGQPVAQPSFTPPPPAAAGSAPAVGFDQLMQMGGQPPQGQPQQ
jgi:hypothetical protein